jgi:hypothetical protein
MMTTTATFDIDKKREFRTSIPAANGQRFSCAGEGCAAKENCARWTGIHKTTAANRNN